MMATLLMILLLAANSVSAFGFQPLRVHHQTNVLHLYNNFQDEPQEEPFFQMQQIPTATTSSRLDHVVECAEKGECDVEEMMAMIDELEELNAECEGTLSRECNLDAVAARNVLKVALASKVMLEEAVQQQELTQVDEECYYDPFSALKELDDECVGRPHGIPTDALKDTNDLDRIVQCASDGDCPLNEMANMIEELERLNLECEGTITSSRECSLGAREARNILKVALGSQAAMARSEYEYKSRHSP